MTKSLVVAKINIKQSKLSYLITAICCGTNLISAFVSFCVGAKDGGSVSIGNMLFLSLILCAVFIPTLNFKKLMHLNVKKINFFYGSFLNYILLSAVLSALNLVIFFTIDKLFMLRTEIMNLVEIFGWINNGIFIAFFQQFAFLLLTAVIIHTLTSLQNSWIGWTVDLIIAAILGVFIPIAPLRAYLLSFFDLIIFNSNALAQIGICIILSVLIYSINLPVLSGKKID